MHHLQRFGYVAATLILLQIIPSQIPVRPLGIEVARGQTTEQLRSGAIRLNQLGLQQFNQGKYQEALKAFEQALAISKQIGDKAGEGATLNNIGGVYNSLGEYPKALLYFQQALAISKQIGDKAGEGNTLNNIGGVYNSLGEYPKALLYFQQALAISKQIGDKAGEGATLNNIGGVYHSLGEYPKALLYYQQALAITKQIGDKAFEGATLNNIGFVYYSLGEYPKALLYYQQALAIRKQIGDKAGEGATLNNIGLVYHSLGEYPKALLYFQQALAISKQIGDKAGEGTTLNNIGGVYKSLGEYPKALLHYQQALAISKQIGDKAGEGATLNNIGGVYKSLGEYPKALLHYQQALAIRKQIGDKAGEGTTLNNIGGVYDSLGQYPKALLHYQQALAIIKQIDGKASEGVTLNNIGAVYHSLKEYPKALLHYQQALAIIKQIGDKASEGATLNNIGFIYDSLGEYPKALLHYQQALAISKQIGNKAGEGTTLNNIGAVYINLGESQQAEKILFIAIEVFEYLRQASLTDDQKISLFETQSVTYNYLQQALIAQNKIDKALEICERSRGRALVYLLASKLPNNANRQSDKLPSIELIKQIAQQQSSTLVQYSLINDASQVKGKQTSQQKLYIWVVKPTGEIDFKKVGVESLNKPLQAFIASSRNSLGVRSSSMFEVNPVQASLENSNEQLHQLYKLLITPIVSQLPKNQNERVIFIPQGSLFSVPFPALIDEQGKYLIEKHTILTAPSIQVLDLARQQTKADGNILVVGNPTMPKIKVGELEQNFKPLPGSEREANAVAQLLNVEALTGSKANKATVVEKMKTARVIHLATHGILDDFKGFGIPGAIVLAPDGKRDDTIDGILTASEIYNMKLRADLVVLSACDTGNGVVTGDGVVGLSRSLLSAGARSVVVSLWKVNDNSTEFLMTQFYRNLQQNPDKAVALRQAMLKTMQQQQYSNPKHWAAFTLIGAES